MIPPPRLVPPHGITEVERAFGRIRDYIRDDGTLMAAWEEQNIARIKLPVPTLYAFGGYVTRITVHRQLASIAGEMYEEIFKLGLWPKLGPYGGGFVFRANRNSSSRISLHAWGIAHDWDPEGFPNGSTAKRNPELHAVMTKYGFVLGEDFHGTPDPMHCQFASGV